MKQDPNRSLPRIPSNANGQQQARAIHSANPPLPPAQRNGPQNNQPLRPPVQPPPTFNRVQAPNLPGPRPTSMQGPLNPNPPNRPQQAHPTQVPQGNAPNLASTSLKPQPQSVPINGSTPPSQPFPSDAAVGFFTARVAENLQSGLPANPDSSRFNPRLESPSIRKTAGFDHSKTAPIAKDTTAPSVPAIPSRFNSPQPDFGPRRLGMPNTMASPLQNRNQYKPPQMMKRSAENPNM